MSSETSPAGLPANLKLLLTEQLDGDEHVLWTAVPNWRRAARQKILAALLGAVVCTYAVYEIFFKHGTSGLSALTRISWGIFFLLGLQLLIAPFRSAWQLRRTLYALTNRRAFVIMMGRQISVQTFKTFRLGHVETLMDGTGGGDLIFGRALQYAPGGPRYEREVGFYALEDVPAAVAALKASHQRPGQPVEARSEEE